METKKSLDYLKIITALLCDVQTLHSEVFSYSALRKTLNKVDRRVRHEGLSFLTKTLPRLGKALDRALAGQGNLDCTSHGFKPIPGTKLPKFLGELFQTVLSSDGASLQDASATSVKSLRAVLFVYYKLELPYLPKDEHEVIAKFERTEQDIEVHNLGWQKIANHLDQYRGSIGYSGQKPEWRWNTIRNARRWLARALDEFDYRDIFPRHGPGAVSTKEKLWDKYRWSAIPARITAVYPFDAYFCASLGHICDTYRNLPKFLEVSEEPFARVCLVPKDSRGPRLISCEPLAFQWIQQGLGAAIVRHVEQHPLTRESVRFTNQQPNRFAAYLGSKHGRYATLDLNEASDRVTVGLVHLLFPEPVLTALMACRSLGTTLPDGKKLTLNKFAPMGSALCFPVLALTVWAILAGGLVGTKTKKGKTILSPLGTDISLADILVYGDDVIVPTELAEHAMILLESFGLKINRDKSCYHGFFRESCGMDAFKGVDVTPVRIRTPWSSSHCPDTYTSWIAYANSMWDRGYKHCYEAIVDLIFSVYDGIPDRSYGLSVPSLPLLPCKCRLPRRRSNKSLQKLEYFVYDSVPKTSSKEVDGWMMLLRYFTEGNSGYELSRTDSPPESGAQADRKSVV